MERRHICIHRKFEPPVSRPANHNAVEGDAIEHDPDLWNVCRV